jgi:hypothetical protein
VPPAFYGFEALAIDAIAASGADRAAGCRSPLAFRGREQLTEGKADPRQRRCVLLLRSMSSLKQHARSRLQRNTRELRENRARRRRVLS